MKTMLKTGVGITFAVLILGCQQTGTIPSDTDVSPLASTDDASVDAASGSVEAGRPGSVDAEYQAVMREILVVTDALNIGRQVGDQVLQSMMASQQASGNPMPPRVQQIIREAASDFFGRILGNEEEMVREQAAIYAKHFTQSELEALLAFYRTPLGSKVMSSLPSVMTEAMSLGQSKIMQEFPRFQAELTRRLAAEGFSTR
jgi:hypothetical protein|tara:strand:+ start:3245 stop:3850 length:606 start_codon:yes stop_codon:yes gene_type:complete